MFCSNSFSCVIINTLIWNCRGALSPSFCNNIKDMVRIHSHSLAIMIIMETKVCGDRARWIVDRLPMDGAIIANSIGLLDGLWLLWDSNQVEVIELSLIEQEIHATVSFSSKPPWLLSAIYGSPRFAERCLL